MKTYREALVQLRVSVPIYVSHNEAPSFVTRVLWACKQGGLPSEMHSDHVCVVRLLEPTLARTDAVGRGSPSRTRRSRLRICRNHRMQQKVKPSRRHSTTRGSWSPPGRA